MKEEESGKELSSEQQKAISKYEEVVQQLSLSKEFFKQFQKIASDASKEAKREARKVMALKQKRLLNLLKNILDTLHPSTSRNGKGTRGFDDSGYTETTQNGKCSK